MASLVLVADKLVLQGGAYIWDPAGHDGTRIRMEKSAEHHSSD